jgi:hypothetical protein
LFAQTLRNYILPQGSGKFDDFAKQNYGGAVKSDFHRSCRVCSHGLHATTFYRQALENSMVLRSKMTAAPSNRIFDVVAGCVRMDFTQLHFTAKHWKIRWFCGAK